MGDGEGEEETSQAPGSERRVKSILAHKTVSGGDGDGVQEAVGRVESIGRMGVREEEGGAVGSGTGRNWRRLRHDL